MQAHLARWICNHRGSPLPWSQHLSWSQHPDRSLHFRLYIPWHLRSRSAAQDISGSTMPHPFFKPFSVSLLPTDKGLRGLKP